MRTRGVALDASALERRQRRPRVTYADRPKRLAVSVEIYSHTATDSRDSIRTRQTIAFIRFYF